MNNVEWLISHAHLFGFYGTLETSRGGKNGTRATNLREGQKKEDMIRN